MTNVFTLTDLWAAAGFTTRLVFGFWPIILIGGLGRRRGKMAWMLGLWLILAAARGTALLLQAPSIAVVLPEPYSTFAFLLVGAMVFLTMFIMQLAKAFPVWNTRPRSRERARRSSETVSRPATEPLVTAPHQRPASGAAVRAAPHGVGGGKIERLWSVAMSAHHPRDLREISGDDFEILVTELYRRQGYQARRVGQWGDHGVDIVVETSDGQKWIVQCKGWHARWIGEPLVRDLFGAMHHEGADRCILVTSSVFSNPARRWARGKPIELIDGTQLLRLVRQFRMQVAHETVQEGALL